MSIAVIPPVPIQGDLELPAGAEAVILFAHGSGSSRFSRRNLYVAERLRDGKLGTLLIDLLTPDEDAVYQTRFDIPLLTNRVLQAAEWLRHRPETAALPIGYFGASTGAAAALVAAAERPELVYSVVSRGGRPDLAAGALRRVQAPALLIVGKLDEEVLELNQDALTQLNHWSRLAIVPHATHLFEEPGALEEVAALALDWFRRMLHHP
jgi:pimeloyl-ACP methyl ester carboxylesterase